MIQVRELTKHYADFQRGAQIALAGISFDAVAGEVFGLLGPNGAGKTTALRILGTVLQPTSGTATINGYDVVGQPSQVRHQIGFVSAGTGVYDRMTAWEMVAYFGRLYDIDEDALQNRMDEIFKQLQMDEIRDVLGVKMSTGMKQKVSIARAMVHNPPVIILDEATSGLDVLVARSLIDIISRLRDQGKCIIFSSHIMREVERLCDRVAIMHRGHILATGSIAELQQQSRAADMEDLFFDLIRDAEEKLRSAEASY
jgi:sodium transport system ATP-binding protein